MFRLTLLIGALAMVVSATAQNGYAPARAVGSATTGTAVVESSVRHLENARILDFLSGNWTYVTASGKAMSKVNFAHNESGRVVIDRWQHMDGTSAVVLFTYNEATRGWSYVWTDSSGWTSTGKVKKTKNGLVLEGETKYADGSSIHERQTLTESKDDIKYRVEQSLDKGKSWVEVSDGLLKKAV